MVTNDEITIYRAKVSRLLDSLRNALYLQSGKSVFPTDARISALLGISPTAFSAINRQCSSMSGVTLAKLFAELYSRLDVETFNIVVSNFVYIDNVLSR